MAVRDRIKEAIDKLSKGEYENALIQVCIAIDATAKKEYPGKKPGERCKKFLRDNQAFITRVGVGLLEIHGDILFASDLKNGKKDKSLEQVLYRLVRCSLLHEGELTEEVLFTTNNKIGMTNEGIIILPINMIWAIILAIVGSGVNTQERLPDYCTISIGKTTMRLNDLWGKKRDIYSLVRRQAKILDAKRSG